eukprot:TRINITY_DN12943_c0_g1_i1.p1 TRINITY_DN12943_c0_g1~~TRINITY_DN12943_c0_g1_i1.p1  ORF type:complete len:801 (-),score=201.24 TRINITY_DN12943_c0_g1_i1:23-2260(-)
MEQQAQGMLWFSNVYPAKTFWADIRQWFTRHNHEQLVPELLPKGVQVVDMQPRMREGGVFVKFRTTPEYRETEHTTKEVANFVHSEVKKVSHYALLTFQPVRCNLVRGQPFLEDFIGRYPSNRLKIELLGGDLSIEKLYDYLRRHGQLVDVLQGPIVKDVPRVITAVFRYTGGAVAARNCLHRMKLDNATLSISYERVFKTSAIADAFSKYPRLMVPIVGILVAGTTYLVFDPLRVFSITNRITGRFAMSNFAAVKWLRSKTGSWLERIRSRRILEMFRRRSSKRLSHDAWAERSDEEMRLRQWLHLSPSRVLLLTGPKGSGKSALIARIAKDARRVVTLDVGAILERGDDEFLKRFAEAVGFFPSATALSALTGMLETFTGGGSKSTGNPTTSHVLKILECVTAALIRLQPAAEAGKEDYPLFIIDGFTADNKDKHDHFLNILAQWAMLVSSSHLARVVFVGDSAFGDESMYQAMQREDLLDIITLNDATQEAAEHFIKRSVDPKFPVEASEVVGILGGRFIDLCTFVDKVNDGIPTQQAVEEIVNAAMVTVRSQLMGARMHKEAKWNRLQLWQTMIALVNSNGALRYDDILFTVFRGDDLALRSLVKTDLVHVEVVYGPDLIRAGSSVLLEAFRRMTQEPSLRAGMDLAVVKQKIEIEMAKITAAEDELVKIQEVQDSVGRYSDMTAIAARKQFLLSYIDEIHAKVSVMDMDRKRCESDLKKAASVPITTTPVPLIGVVKPAQ